ncbi:Zinc finger protein 76, partial [Globisporangium splendens]
MLAMHHAPSPSDAQHAKLAMLGSSSPIMTTSSSPSSQQQPMLRNLRTMLEQPTMLDRELLQHYAYLRYGNGSGHNTDKNGRKQHVCPVRSCGRRFSTPGNLSRHKRLHGPVKPLKCPVAGCICAFRSENKLEKHMKFHLGIPVHVCPVPACGKTFSTAGNLNRHIKGHHPDVDTSEFKSYSTAGSSCDEYESSVGGDEVMRERMEEAESEQRFAASQLPHQRPDADAPELDALVAVLDQDIDGQDELIGVPEVAHESMLELLLLDRPERKYSLLDDMIRFHIDQIEDTTSEL